MAQSTAKKNSKKKTFANKTVRGAKSTKVTKTVKTKKPTAKKASKTLSWKPGNFHVLTPGCSVRRSAEAVGFYQTLFNAKVRSKMQAPDGTVMHADLAIGDSNFMIGAPMPNMPERTMSLMVYTSDPDALFQKATASGCQPLEQPTDQFWGDRTARVMDPFGNDWMFSKKVENVSDTEMGRRAQKVMTGQPWR
jgi:uncharacterized glyoxalase superfamily protein PhnB